MNIESRKYVMERANSILDWKFRLNEETRLTNTGTPDFKEGLVVYFSQVDDASFDRAMEKLNAANTKYVIKPKLPPPSNPEFYDGDSGKSFDVVKTAIKHLNQDELSPKDKQFYFNAISIAKTIRKNFRGPVQADRGATYSKIRKQATMLIDAEYEIKTQPDKWCPADIYIYSSPDSIEKALSAKSINQGKNSLNALFQIKDKKMARGILGISLKEAQAQAGKATSFSGVLTRAKNYKEAPRLPDILDYIMFLFYNVRTAKEIGGFRKTKEPDLHLANRIESIKYLVKGYNAANRLDKLGMRGGSVKKIMAEIEAVLKKEVGSSILNASTSSLGYDSKKIKLALIDKFTQKHGADLTAVKVKGHVLDNSRELIRLMNLIAKNITDEATSEYKKQKAKFTKVLKDQGFSKPQATTTSTNVSQIGQEIEGIETFLKKARCYSTAEWLLGGLNAAKLEVPPVYKTIIEQKNAFVAITAYAIGMAGVSPTFFKYVGNNTGGDAHVEPFWGNGFLNLEGKESGVQIVDNPDSKGFSVIFFASVTLENVPGSDVVSRYQVTLDFRYSGDQVNIEVQQLKGR